MVSGQTAQGEVGKRDRETWGDVRREGGPSPWSPVEADRDPLYREETVGNPLHKPSGFLFYFIRL